MSNNCVVHLQQILVRYWQWLLHVARHELKHHALEAGSENQTEPDEEQQNDSTEALTWQLQL
jgi:hypothetical protein